MNDKQDYIEKMHYALAFTTENIYGTDEYWWSYLHELKERNIDEVTFLIEALKADSWRVRDGAVQMIAFHYNHDKRVVASLLDTLQDEQADVRAHTIEALGKVGDERSIKPIVQALQDDNRLVWRIAISVLMHQFKDDAIDPLVTQFATTNAEVQSRIVITLEGIGSVKAYQALAKIRQSE